MKTLLLLIGLFLCVKGISQEKIPIYDFSTGEFIYVSANKFIEVLPNKWVCQEENAIIDSSSIYSAIELLSKKWQSYKQECWNDSTWVTQELLQELWEENSVFMDGNYLLGRRGKICWLHKKPSAEEFLNSLLK